MFFFKFLYIQYTFLWIEHYFKVTTIINSQYWPKKINKTFGLYKFHDLEAFKGLKDDKMDEYIY